jgi:hypothetical protein
LPPITTDPVKQGKIVRLSVFGSHLAGFAMSPRIARLAVQDGIG